MLLIVVTIILVCIAGISNAIMDILQHKFKLSIFYNSKFNELFWNPRKSWKNKWTWSNGALKEKFLGSSTVFVFVTDAWHLFQFIYNTCWQLAISIHTPYPVVSFVVLKTLNSGVFELFYKYILKKR